jgi:hypothetical protein
VSYLAGKLAFALEGCDAAKFLLEPFSRVLLDACLIRAREIVVADSLFCRGPLGIVGRELFERFDEQGLVPQSQRTDSSPRGLIGGNRIGRSPLCTNVLVKGGPSILAAAQTTLSPDAAPTDCQS